MKNTTTELHQEKLPKEEQKKAFDKTISQTHEHMTRYQQTISRVIHIRFLDSCADFLEMTLLRPLPILMGALFAIITLVASYLPSKYIGYPLGGGEALFGLLIGWCVGLCVDICRRFVVSPKRHKRY